MALYRSLPPLGDGAGLIQRYWFAFKIRLNVEHTLEEIFDARKEFALFIGIDIGIRPEIAIHTRSINAKAACIVERAVEMIFLRHNDAFSHAEDMAQPIHTVIR